MIKAFLSEIVRSSSFDAVDFVARLCSPQRKISYFWILELCSFSKWLLTHSLCLKCSRRRRSMPRLLFIPTKGSLILRLCYIMRRLPLCHYALTFYNKGLLHQSSQTLLKPLIKSKTCALSLIEHRTTHFCCLKSNKYSLYNLLPSSPPIFDADNIV